MELIGDEFRWTQYDNIKTSIINSSCTTTQSGTTLTEDCSYKLNETYILNIIDSSELVIYGILMFIFIRFFYKLTFK